MAKVLVVATSRKTRGGITSVIKAHEKGGQWERFNCRWIETHRDGGFLRKLLYVLRAFTQYLFLLSGNDIVHIHIGEAPSALRKMAFMAYAKLWQKKTIVHFHSFSPDTTIKSRYSFLYRYLFTRADKVIVLSEYWKNEVNGFVPDADIEILYNPCTTEVAIDDDIIKEPYILYAGTVSQRKGYADMIKAFSLIAERHPEWNIVFAGNGEIEQGQTLAGQYNIQDQTKWLGWVNGEAKDLAFRKASVFCLPSYAEGFSMAVLDAWAYGLPVITTPVGGIPDVAIDGENMLLFQPGDCQKLSQCMELMIENDELRHSISIESKNLAATKFNINTINTQLAGIYERLVDTNECMKSNKNCILLALLIAWGLFSPATAVAQTEGKGVYHFESDGNPIIKHTHTADPAVIVEGDTLWLFTGHDKTGGLTNYVMEDWLLFSTTDMKHWDEYPVPLSIDEFKWAESKQAFAGQAIKKNGKYYWYVSTNWCGIGIAVSDRITGPYHDALGKPLLTTKDCFDSTHSWACIDPTVFTDDDGKSYLAWGNRECYIAKLKDNMIEIDGPVHRIEISSDHPFEEAPWLHKYNGHYYLTYASGFPEKIAYAMADNIFGPYHVESVISEIAGNSNTTHPAIVEFKGQWLFFSHNGGLKDGGGYSRSVIAEYLEYDNNDRILNIPPSADGVKAVVVEK